MANINHQNNLGNTPLHHGFQCGTSLEIVELLLNRGANVHIRNFNGQSLFHTAANSYHSLSEATDLLLKHGVSLKAIDDQGSTVLHEVLKNSSVTLKIIEKLLKYGAQSDHRDEKGYPPLAYCKSSNLLPEERVLAEKLLIQFSVLKKINLIRTPDFEDTEGVGDSVICYHFCQDKQKRKEWEIFRDSCIAEIKLMRKLDLGHDFTLSDLFVNYDYIEGPCYDLNEFQLKSILVSLQCNKFPIYQDIVISAIEGHDFDNYMDDLNWFVVKSISCKRRAITLSTDCVKEIVKFLSEKDQISLILAYCKF